MDSPPLRTLWNMWPIFFRNSCKSSLNGFWRNSSVTFIRNSFENSFTNHFDNVLINLWISRSFQSVLQKKIIQKFIKNSQFSEEVLRKFLQVTVQQYFEKLLRNCLRKSVNSFLKKSQFIHMDISETFFQEFHQQF